ncbi:Effector protein GPP [Meloidogyne graminicola]|uniref:Effector protein GPP n=1 Tax=Meloidogyne graminicola TaxID=189291 RepID=A0A8S9ZRR9_9BILA|nr:Effector protein GPP [Meloidogyne graminicola]
MLKNILSFLFIFILIKTFVFAAEKCKKPTLPPTEKLYNCPPIKASTGGKYISPINNNMTEKLTRGYQACTLCPKNVKECYIRPLYTPQETGLVNANEGIINKYLNKPMSGKFFFHAYTDKNRTLHGGACGLGLRYSMHAGVSRYLWEHLKGTWVKSDLDDLPFHAVRDEAACINKGVRIEYDGKILTIPIMDSTYDIELNEIDLTFEAFDWLKPDTCSSPKPATITFISYP